MKRFACTFLRLKLLCCALGAVFLSPASLAEQYHCAPQTQVVLNAKNNNMLPYVCDAANRTIAFLGEYGLKPQRNIYINVIGTTMSFKGYKALGSYNRQLDRITMMSLHAIQKNNPDQQMYDLPLDEEQYVGAIAHEITHAIFQHNSIEIEEKWNNAAHEYLAHATQLGVLSQTTREKIIQNSNSGAWETGDEVSVTYMAFNPTGFAVKSYLHLVQLPDPLAFIKVLMNHKWLYVSVP